MEVKLLQIREDEKLTQDPDFWNDPKKAEATMKQIRNKKLWTDAYQKCQSAVDDAQVLYEFFKEGEVDEAELDGQYKLASTELEELEFTKKENERELDLLEFDLAELKDAFAKLHERTVGLEKALAEASKNDTRDGNGRFTKAKK